jgi:transposase-like protein
MTEILSHHPHWCPPFCPNPNCCYHNDSALFWPYKRIGFYRRTIPPYRIQRYLCLRCRRSFSRQTFSPTYWLKRPRLLFQLLTKTCGAMANRQVARDLGCAPSTVDRQLARLGRHCLLLHTTILERARPPQDIVIDGFESFEWSQYFPFHHHVVVEPDSGFFSAFSDSPLRRKGRMTEHQRRRRRELEARLGRPDPSAVRRDMTALVQHVLSDCRKAVVRSDKHHSYKPALRRVACRIEHRVTDSRQRRDRQNPLWEVNLLDLLIRHNSANHRRETLAWSKRRQGSAMRLAVFLVWRNYVQRRWVKGRPPKTPAMWKGLCDRPMTVAEVLRERLFVSRVRLWSRWREYYWGRVVTPALSINRRHELKLAV